MINEQQNNIGESLAFSVKKTSLVKSLARACSIIEKRNVIPILTNVMLVVENNILQIIATDMDILICENLQVEIEMEGKTTVCGQVFYDVIRKLEDQDHIRISFFEESKALKIDSGKCSFQLPTLPYSDFPKTDIGEYDYQFSLPRKILIKMLDAGKCAVSVEETRYNLNGVYLEYDQGISSVTTDGHRLCLMHCRKSDVECTIPEFKAILIPRKTAIEMRKLIEDSSGNAILSLSNTKVKIEVENSSLFSRLIDATFPDYKVLIPESNDIVTKIKSKDLYNALNRVATVTNDQYKGIKFVFRGETLLMSANSDNIGGAQEKIALCEPITQDIELILNSRYILDCMNVVEGEEVSFVMKDPHSSIVISDNSSPSFQYVVMPMRI